MRGAEGSGRLAKTPNRLRVKKVEAQADCARDGPTLREESLQPPSVVAKRRDIRRKITSSRAWPSMANPA